MLKFIDFKLSKATKGKMANGGLRVYYLWTEDDSQSIGPGYRQNSKHFMHIPYDELDDSERFIYKLLSEREA